MKTDNTKTTAAAKTASASRTNTGGGKSTVNSRTNDRDRAGDKRTDNDGRTVPSSRSTSAVYRTQSSGRTTSTAKTSDRSSGSDSRKDSPSDKTMRGSRPSAQTEFHKFFVDQLKDIYWAEKHLKSGLRKMSRAATSPRLASMFEKHYKEGDEQIAQLETIFSLLGEKPEAKRCEAMAGLLEEASGMISDTERNSFVRDAGLILAAQKVEHYEIATYGTLCALAAYLPDKKVRRMLDAILSDEKKTDQALTRVAEEFVNECAAVE